MSRKNSSTKLTNRSSVRQISVKCYDEQLPNGLDNIQCIDRSELEVYSICHDRDVVTDDFWAEALEKPHYHFLCRVPKNCSPTKVGTILNKIGVVFRHPEDDNLIKEHGVEPVRDFEAMLCYLTHDTEEAIQDGKEHYSTSEIVSNIPLNEIEDIRSQYGGRLRASDRRDLDVKVRKLPELLIDFDDWWDDLSPDIRIDNRLKRMLHDTYDHALERYVPGHKYINRLSIYLQGPAGSGKSYACSQLEKPYIIDGGGTGKFDRLKVTHKTLVVNDYPLENILNVTDNYINTLYRRNSNNPYFFGDLVVVTSNLSFDRWLDSCGVDILDNDIIKAFYSRFYICHLDENFQIIIDHERDRGTADEQKQSMKRFNRICTIIQNSINQYQLKRQSDSPDFILDSSIPF